MIAVHDSHDGSITIELAAEARANALNDMLVESLIEAIERTLESPPALLVLRGRGRSFCAGFDLHDLNEETESSLIRRFLRIEHLLQLVQGAPCLTLALAHGPVAGAGADLLVACAQRIVAPDTTLRFPGARFGVVLGTGRLLRLVGDRGLSLVLGQQTLDAAAAQRLGLVDAVLAADAWPAHSARLAADAATVPAQTRRALAALRCRHNDEDLGRLAASLLVPGLKDRMAAYWRQVAQARIRPAAAPPGPS